MFTPVVSSLMYATVLTRDVDGIIKMFIDLPVITLVTFGFMAGTPIIRVYKMAAENVDTLVYFFASFRVLISSTLVFGQRSAVEYFVQLGALGILTFLHRRTLLRYADAFFRNVFERLPRLGRNLQAATLLSTGLGAVFFGYRLLGALFGLILLCPDGIVRALLVCAGPPLAAYALSVAEQDAFDEDFFDDTSPEVTEERIKSRAKHGAFAGSWEQVKRFAWGARGCGLKHLSMRGSIASRCTLFAGAFFLVCELSR
mmetsp:Transcript_30105/g.67492  ORF Transcript_30105/g.67492 Transcript_30105/m.67492 type:complete len:257 (+) Transcript_30105:35-805(+)